jgi:hypothetical protein
MGMRCTVDTRCDKWNNGIWRIWIQKKGIGGEFIEIAVVRFPYGLLCWVKRDFLIFRKLNLLFNI